MHVTHVTVLQAVAYLMLAVYLDNVLPHEEGGGVTRPWYYLLQPGYWLPSKVSWISWDS